MEFMDCGTMTGHIRTDRVQRAWDNEKKSHEAEGTRVTVVLVILGPSGASASYLASSENFHERVELSLAVQLSKRSQRFVVTGEEDDVRC